MKAADNSHKSRECKSSDAAGTLSPGCGAAAISQADAQGSSFPYEDIVNTPWPRGDSSKADVSDAQASAAFKAGAGVEFRERMMLDERAKIFAPFAALKGFAAACRNVEQQKYGDAAVTTTDSQ